MSTAVVCREADLLHGVPSLLWLTSHLSAVVGCHFCNVISNLSTQE